MKNKGEYVPLCSPRKTSLNFLRGLPKSPEDDMSATMSAAAAAASGRKQQIAAARESMYPSEKKSTVVHVCEQINKMLSLG